MVTRIVAQTHGKSFLEHAVFSVIPIRSSNKLMFIFTSPKIVWHCSVILHLVPLMNQVFLSKVCRASSPI